ncbi:hypothetical protein K3495_g13137 [Podosphaera aphanis]|nr:hypothetical protein K3495_g13137 [Podosphaera aphanis]
MTGVGGSGPLVSHDTIISFQFKTPESWSNIVKVSCGIVPDNTFPGDLTLGKSVFHFLNISFNKDNSLTILNSSPPIVIHPFSSNRLSYSPSTFTILTPNFHMSTPNFAKPFLDLYLSKFPELFNKRLRCTEELSKTVHRIDTQGHPPIKLPPRRYSPSQVEALRDFCQTHMGTILQPSTSPWAAPVLLTPKKSTTSDGKPIWRTCVDYRSLNNITKKHAYPLPNVQDAIQRASGHSYYCFLDLENGFWHIRLAPEDREKAAFVTPFGLFEWTVMPFGLCNAPATFQSFMEEVLEPYRHFVSGLLDDVCVFADTPEQLHAQLLLLFERFAKYGLLLNASKCRFFVPEGIFLGFHVSKHGIAADPSKISAITDRPMPKTSTEIRSFVNAAGYFRSLIDRFSDMSAPLTKLSSGPKNATVHLTAEATKAYNDIKRALTTTPVLRKFDWRLPIVVESDASKITVGAALLQPHTHLRDSKPSSTLHPISYFSKKLTPTQVRYSAQERELLGIVLALQHWRHWVEGADVTVVTDHESLKTIQTKVEQPARIVRFLDALEHYGIRIVYRPGKANVLADYLSRPSDSIFVNAQQQHVDPLAATTDFVTNPDHLNRIDLQAIYEYFSLGHSLPPKLYDAWVRQNFAVHQGKLYKSLLVPDSHVGDPPAPQGAVFLQEVPNYNDLVNIITSIHEAQGHATIGTTSRHVLERYWHPELLLAAHEAVRTCKSCQLMKPPDPTLPDLQPLLPAPPLTRWGIDHTQLGSYYILNAIEYSTGWLESRFVNTTNFDDTIPLLSYIISVFGAPREIISDNAGCFMGTAATNFKSRHKIISRPITPSRPRGNGKVEQANGVLKGILTQIFLENPKMPFIDALTRAVVIYNRRVGPSGYSPYFLLFGTRPPGQQITFMAYTRDPTPEEDQAWAQELARQHAAPIARSYVASAKAIRARVRSYLQETKGLTRVYAPGDWVLRVRQRTNKFEPYYDGPWAISACHPGNTYSLVSPGGFPMANKYNGTNLFPAYVRDGHPVKSLWYGSQRLLESDRNRLRVAAGI